MKMKRLCLISICLVLAASGCSSRKQLIPDKAMLGQWKSIESKYYISPEKITFHNLASGDRSSSKYKIVKVNELEPTVDFIYPDAPLSSTTTLKFSPDNSSFELTIDHLKETTKMFTYVDSKQEP